MCIIFELNYKRMFDCFSSLLCCSTCGELLFICWIVCYQGKLEKLEAQFEHIERERLQNPKAGMVCIALVNTDMEDGTSEDVFLRARVQEVNGDKVSATCLPLAIKHYSSTAAVVSTIAELWLWLSVVIDVLNYYVTDTVNKVVSCLPYAR